MGLSYWKWSELDFGLGDLVVVEQIVFFRFIEVVGSTGGISQTCGVSGYSRLTAATGESVSMGKT